MNYKSGAWSGEREAATRRLYGIAWRKRNPGYMRAYRLAQAAKSKNQPKKPKGQ